MTDDSPPARIDLAREGDFRLGELQVSPSTRQVKAKDTGETLQPRIMQVLVALARRRGEVVSRDDLIELCWEGRVVGEDALSRCIQKLRRLGEDHAAFNLETIPRVGYRLTVSDQPNRNGSGVAQGSHAPGKNILLMWVGAGLALVIAVVAGFLLLQPARALQQRTAFFGFEAPAGADATLAGLAPAVTNRISEALDFMHVETVAPAETMSPGGDAAGGRLARAKRLRALYALSGNVRTEGEDVIAAIRLEDVPSQTTLWEESITVSRAEAALLPHRTAAIVASTLECLVRFRADNQPEKLDVIRLLPRVCRESQAPITENIAFLRQTAKAAPTSARIQANLACGFALSRNRFSTAEQGRMLAEAEEAIARGLKLNPDLPTLYLAQYLVAVWKGASLAELEGILRSGLAVSPDDTFLQLWMGNFLMGTGRFAEALTYSKAAANGDPFRNYKVEQYGLALLANGRGPEAVDVFARALDRMPSANIWRDWMIATVFANGGAPEDVLARAPLKLVRNDQINCWQELVANGGRDRLPMIKRVKECWKSGSLDPTSVMIALAALGDIDGSFAALEATDPQLEVNKTLILLPWLANVRSNSRFRELAAQRGLIDYWKSDERRRPDFCKTEAVTCKALGLD